MTAFSYASNFNAVSVGPFTTAAKTKAWGVAPAYDGDPTGVSYSIVTGGRYGGQCCKCKFPKGQNGSANEEYQMFRDSSGVVVNLEFDFQFLVGFDLTRDVGKIGPSIMWGPRSGASAGVMVFVVWSQAKSGQPAVFELAVQNNATGGNYNQPIARSSPITLGQWYHWKFQMLGGSGGYVTAELDGAPFASYTDITTWPTNIGDTVMYDDYFHCGGGGPGPSVDCYALQDNIQYYSGTGGAALSAGAFLLTGKSSAFQRGRSLASAAGSFALTGVAILAAGTWQMTASAGALALTGKVAVFSRAMQFVASGAAFTLSGAAVAFTRELHEPAAAGAFVLSGLSAALSVFPYRVAASAGAFLLTGVAATLSQTIYGPPVPPAPRPRSYRVAPVDPKTSRSGPLPDPSGPATPRNPGPMRVAKPSR